ncbi:MAG: hypothetical protein PHH59_09910 [Methylovulum sp.]|uniref:hypothetical protein n=1 Tax=Methylovulum sp. TaxID=1916980 RepID=UPI0026025F84|nr:hypothetical protein [Methylovulum sp.]MDD2724321.1 hypothetical protein [Methylovulum sp.]MDD5124965.1 hypothetical protein [Methylovulum sp.]
MNIIKSTSLAALVTALLSTTAYAHNNFAGTLGVSTTARDVILFKCSGQVGITVGSVSAQDGPTVNAAAKIKVQIAKATSSSTCPAFASPAAPADLTAAGWTAGQLTGNDSGAWSTRTNISVSQVSPNNYYCIAVTKDVANNAVEDYSLNQHCEVYSGDPTHQASTFSPAPLGYLQDQ